MNQDELFDALDGLFAYDQGATDSGIHDEILKMRVQSHLEDINEEDFRLTMSIFIRDHFVSEEAIKNGYGIEDVAGFIDWLRNNMAIDI